MTEPGVPAGFERRWTDIGGVRIHDVATIDRSRSTVVLVPGIGLSHRVMLPIAELLAPHFAVRAPDPPGFGRSDKPRRPLEVPELADALAAWIEAAGIGRPALVGNSFGCQIIVELAARHPNRVACAVLQGPTMDAAARSLPRQSWRWLRDTFQERPDPWARLRDYRDAGLRRVLATTGSPCATASRTSYPASSPRPWSCAAPTTPSSPRPGPRPSPACSRRASWWSPPPAPTPSSASWSRSPSHSCSATSRQQADAAGKSAWSRRCGRSRGDGLGLWVRRRDRASGSTGGCVMGVNTTHLEDEEIKTVWPGVRAQGGATVSDGDSGDDADSGDSGDDSNSSDSGGDSDSDSGDSGDSGDDSDSTDR